MSDVPVFGEPDPSLPLVERPGSYAVIRDEDGRVAAVRSQRGRLHLPGGGADPGETALDTLHRELREELGRGCRVVADLGRADCHVPVPDEGASFLKQGTFFEVELLPRDRASSVEYELLWVDAATFTKEAAEGSHVWALGRVMRESDAVD